MQRTIPCQNKPGGEIQSSSILPAAQEDEIKRNNVGVYLGGARARHYTPGDIYAYM